MMIRIKTINKMTLRFSVIKQDEEIGRAYLYLLKNDLHQQPFGFIEDVFIEESHRGQGYGSALIKRIISEAKIKNCYKLICTSRYKNTEVHHLYEKLGFSDYGKEFRMNV